VAIVLDKSGNTPNGNGGVTTDKPYCTFNRSGGASPVTATITPQYVGERYLDTTTGIIYQATASNNTAWQVATIAKETGA
jgi:hypothetical protein